MRERIGICEDSDESLTLSETSPVQDMVGGDITVAAKNLRKVTTMLTNGKNKEADRRMATEQLGEGRELFVRQALELSGVKRDIENFTNHKRIA